jgi:putative methionine-R-sulfoxide reductase with GAF domain
MNRTNSENEVITLLQNNLQSPIFNLLDLLAAALYDNFPHYTGVYIYLLEDETLMLGPYRGRPTEHMRIPVGKGICGRAARLKETVTVDDVNADAEYIACSIETRSEIVVPIMRGERVFGEIDIDSDVPAAFSPEDRRFLEEVARLIASQWTLLQTA